MTILCDGRKPSFQTAKKDRKVYKVLIPNNNRRYNVEWMTPFAGAPIGKDVLDGTKPFIALGKAHFKWSTAHQMCFFSEGYIHCYTRREDAEYVAKHYFVGSKVFPVTIPKGAKYVVGLNKVFRDYYRETIASKIIFFDNGSGKLF